MQVDLDRLRIAAPQLHDALARHIGYKTGVREVADFSGINPPEIRLSLVDWAQRDEWTQKREKQKAQDEEFQKRLATVKNEQAAPPPPPVVQSARDYEQPAEPRVTIDFEQTLREEAADLQRRADETAAKNRLNQYATEQGLEDTQANFSLIKKYVAANTKTTYWSEQIVDLAVQNLRSQLTWRAKEAPAPPPPAQEPVEVLGNLPNGEPRLPLDTTPTKKHSAAQLKDWLARVNEGRRVRPSGSFRSSIF